MTLPQDEIVRQEAYLASLNSANEANRTLFASQIQNLDPRGASGDEEDCTIGEAPEDAQSGENNVFEDTYCEGEAQEDSGIDLSGAITPTPLDHKTSLEPRSTTP